MSFITKDVIHTTLVDVIYNEILSRRSNYYYFIGRVLPWPSPLSPEVPENTFYYEYITRNSIIAVKKIQTTDLSYVVPRRNWSSGTVYDQFDGNYSVANPAFSGATSLKSANFYVLTTDFNVYKVLFNNNNSQSTTQPTGTSAVPITTADGYLWKYLYSIPLSLRNRFLTEEFMPVQRSVLNPYYSNGEIDRVNIDNTGTGYIGNAQFSLTVDGTFNSSPGNVVSILTPVLSTGGSIEKVIITNRGNNYQSANIILNDFAGDGESFYKGIEEVIITNAGAGYTNEVINNTSVSIATTGTAQPTSNALFQLSFNNNTLVNVVVLNSGSGYNSNVAANTTATITTTGSTQATNNAEIQLKFANSAILTPVLKDGQIDRVIIRDPGLSYRSNLQTSILVTGDGSGANLLPFVNAAGQIEDVIILDRGEGYTFASANVIGDGTGANLSIDLSTGDLDTTQSTVELSAISGALYAFKVNNGGNGYSSANITVFGDGTGFQGTVNVSNTNTISSVTIVNPGSGYTFANVVISGNGSNANVSAIISPQGGHGSDAIKELFSDTLIFFSTITNERIHGITVNNDYRQFGIIKDLDQFGNQRAFSNTNGTPTFLVSLDTLTDSTSNVLSKDTVLTIAGNVEKTFEVVETVSGNNFALITSLNNYQLLANDTLNDFITDSNFIVQSVNATPTINKFSGDLLFIDNRTSVSFSDEQIVTLRTVIKL